MAGGLRETSLFNDANLVAYYELENTSDSKGSFTLTNNNSVTFTAARFSNGGNLGSGNTNKSLSVANDLGITGGACSFTFWIKLIDEIGSASWDLFGQGDGGNFVNFSIQYEYNGGTRRLVFERKKAGVAAQSFTHNATLGTSDFHHLVITYNGTTLKGYVDNTATTTVAASGNGASGASDELKIGSGYNLTFASAIVDDFAVFTDELTAAEVDTLFNSPLSSSGGTDEVTGYFYT